jgi:predicted AAA+ superfamily ATPase
LGRRRAEVSYVKAAGGLEVDFLARYPSGEAELIQVCADAGARQTAERELRRSPRRGRRFRGCASGCCP